VPHLLDSDPFDHHFVVETDNDGRAILRFGDDEFGMAPLDGSDIFVTYRVGVGRKGNIGMESLVHIVEPEPLPPDWPEIASVTPELPKPVRNTLSAWGGIEPETNDQVKLLAPKAFHAEQFRAVTEDDYVVAAEKYSEVSKAVATFRWTGSWHTVFLTIDPVGQTDLTEDMESRIRSHIARYRLAGYDIEIDPPIYVPLEIEINVCAARDHFRAHVKEALINALSNRAFPDRSKGFFHPDDFTFAQSVYLSKLYKAVEQVDGVDSAEVIQFKRFGQKEDGELEQGYIPIGRLEVARLDNDPSYPENGILRLNMMGGK
jgi:predicted phage baseplate assembly protein